MSSGLSSTCATATSIAEEYNGRVQVVNNQRISVTQDHLVFYIGKPSIQVFLDGI